MWEVLGYKWRQEKWTSEHWYELSSLKQYKWVLCPPEWPAQLAASLPQLFVHTYLHLIISIYTLRRSIQGSIECIRIFAMVCLSRWRSVIICCAFLRQTFQPKVKGTWGRHLPVALLCSPVNPGVQLCHGACPLAILFIRHAPVFSDIARH